MPNQANKSKQQRTSSVVMPVMPLRDVVVYPHMVIPLFVGRKASIHALDHAMTNQKEIFLVAQSEANIENPSMGDLFKTGTIATILQLLKLPDGTVKVLVEGVQRGQVVKYSKSDDGQFLLAEIAEVYSPELSERESEILCRSLIAQFDQYVRLNKKVPQEVVTSLNGIEDAERLVDSISAHIALKLNDKQKLIEIVDIRERIENLMTLLESEIDLINVEKKIRRRVKTQMEKSQREYYLNEQIKAIQHELGDEEGIGGELKEIASKIEKSGMTKEAREKVESELKKLKMMPGMSAEATVCRNYIDWMLNIPWKKTSKVSDDLIKAEEVLEYDHYGLEKVKERILEYLAVQQRVKKQKGPILCLVGPPGVGKTSLGQSIARATNREFVRMSLGGVRDEAEIRGHRRTYIGSMPGKIVQKLAKVKVKNPLFLLDEIDKMAMDFRGDPAAALLEVLDPEQNDTFNDHYLEVDYNLSDVMFIATSNSMNIPPALLDRMEVIRIAGYTEDEKLHIAQKYLVKSQLEKNGIKPEEFEISEAAILNIIRYYTREAGVRNLDRMISKLCRKTVKQILTEKLTKVIVDVDNLEDYLGVKQYRYGMAEEKDRIGQVNGLAWTEVGGELLTIEAAIMPGTGKTSYTGQLGDVMKESIQAATSVIRARSENLKLPEHFHEKIDVHIHVPEGATPKDGPSAGIGMCVALISALTGIPVKADVAMTGEITLRGDVLPIGGLKEKLLAAKRAGIRKVIIPHENVKDIKEIPNNITASLDIKPVKIIDEVLKEALAEKVLVGVTKSRTVHEIINTAKKTIKPSDNERHFNRH